MKFIEDLRDKPEYVDEECFIIGSGLSLDDYPGSPGTDDDWFLNKFTIAVNYSFLGIFEPTFIASIHAPPIVYIKKKLPHLLSRCIAFCPVDRTHSSNGMAYNQIGDYGESVIYAETSISGQSKENFQKTANAIMAKQPALFRARGSITHLAIQAAVVLGAKKITLIGCEEKAGRFRYHATRGGIYKFALEPLDYHPPLKGLKEYPKEWQEGTIKGPPKHREGQVYLAEIYKPLGIEIKKYFYGTSYEDPIL